MVDDWVIKTMYATKRRRKNPKCVKPLGLNSRHEQNIKSNPSKRHRERLNSELEHLASLLPFEQNVIVKLDKLSILRLAVSYLRMKCYFQAFSFERALTESRLVSHLYPCPLDMTRIEGETCLKAFNGFIFIMSCDGEVFSVSKTVEHYLGFHQADILHQSILELIHSEDREEFRRQLSWKYKLPTELHACSINDLMNRADLANYLKRRFTVRFRCLLDNTSGFITLELSGRLQYIHGQTRGNRPHSVLRSVATASAPSSNSSMKHNTAPSMGFPPLGMFVVCSPLGPVPSLSGSQRDMTFKTKHQLDLTIISIDARTKALFNYTDNEVQRLKVYDLVHPEDLRYVAQGHREVFQTGSIGLLAHRWLNKSGQWVWLQSRVKLSLKNGKHDHIVAIHRHLSQQEGMEMLSRRSDEYKLPFPLLEPETLLNEDGLPVKDIQPSESDGKFMTDQFRDMEYNYLGSVINGTPGGFLEKPRAEYNNDPSISAAMDRNPSFRINPFVPHDREQGNRSSNESRDIGSHIHSDHPKLSRSRGKCNPKLGPGRRKKNTTKDFHHKSINHMYSVPSDFYVSSHMNMCSNKQTNQYDFNQCSSSHGHTGLHYLQSVWRAGPLEGTDRNPFAAIHSGHSGYGQFWCDSQRVTDEAHLLSPKGHPISDEYRNTSACPSLQNYPTYPFTYDAYTVAAAAMVAAASGCQQQLPKRESHNDFPHFESTESHLNHLINTDGNLVSPHRTDIGKLTTDLPWRGQKSVQTNDIFRMDYNYQKLHIMNRLAEISNSQFPPTLNAQTVESRKDGGMYVDQVLNQSLYQMKHPGLSLESGCEAHSNDNLLHLTQTTENRFKTGELSYNSSNRHSMFDTQQPEMLSEKSCFIQSHMFNTEIAGDTTMNSLQANNSYLRHWSHTADAVQGRNYGSHTSPMTIPAHNTKDLTSENKSTSSMCSSTSSGSRSPNTMPLESIGHSQIEHFPHQHRGVDTEFVPQDVMDYSTEHDKTRPQSSSNSMEINECSKDDSTTNQNHILDELGSLTAESSHPVVTNNVKHRHETQIMGY